MAQTAKKKRAKKKAAVGAGRRGSRHEEPRGEAPTPLTETQLRRKLKRRRAKTSTKGLTATVDILVAAPGRPKVSARVSARDRNVVIRPDAPLAVGAGRRRGLRLQVKIQGAELGTHVFPPSISGQQLRLPRSTVAVQRLARLGLPDLEGHLPNHLPLNPIPPRIERRLRVSRYLSANTGRLKRNQVEATTVFPPEDRYTFSDTSFPWSTIGRVDTAGGVASGVMVGPRHMLTVSHAMVWLAGNSAGSVRFRPSFFDGSAPFGEAWATRWYAYRKVFGPTLSRAESREDYVVLVMDRRIGDITGWMGSRTYSDSWDGVNYWRHIGYPGDLTASQRPSYERDISLDGSSVDGASHQRAFHQGDVWPGQSGGPFFAWWAGETWPRVVSVQSGQTTSNNLAAAGSRMVNLIIQARNDFP